MTKQKRIGGPRGVLARRVLKFDRTCLEMEQAWLVSLLMNPAGEKFEPTHVGCHGVSSGGFNRRFRG